MYTKRVNKREMNLKAMSKIEKHSGAWFSTREFTEQHLAWLGSDFWLIIRELIECYHWQLSEYLRITWT